MVVHDLFQCAFYLVDAFFQTVNYISFHYAMLSVSSTRFQLDPVYTARQGSPAESEPPSEQYATSPSATSERAFNCATVCGFRLTII